LHLGIFEQPTGGFFERFAHEVKEKRKLDIRTEGTLRKDGVYAVAPPDPGTKIA
jgi:hypothetical protein